MPIEGAVLQADHRSPHTDDAVLQSGATVFTVAEAKAIVRRITRAAASMDPDAIADLHTEDCVVAFVQRPEFHGRLAARDFMASRPRFGLFRLALTTRARPSPPRCPRTGWPRRM